MHLSDYDYELPPERIAQEPLAERDASRLLVLDRRSGRLDHRRFTDLPGLLAAGDRLVVNDTRVIPVRLFGRRAGGSAEVEILLLGPAGELDGRPSFEALARPARKLPAGSTIRVGSRGTEIRVVKELDSRKRVVAFPEGLDVERFLDREGHVPLPPYIHRRDRAEDRERYQTIFARDPGAVAAPTAGLHFTSRTLEALEAAGIGVTAVTLDVGLGTFAPVLEEDPQRHVMEREYFRISPRAAEEIAHTRGGGGRIVAVGTTVVRALESAEPAREGEAWVPRAGEGWSELFIRPPYTFRQVDALVTNFHLPRSTLLMLVSALAGRERILEAYREAVAAGYRFYSYGDAMLVL